MGFNYQTAAAAGRGFDQSTQQMFGLIMQNYMQEAGQKKRQANLAKAMRELYPQLSDSELDAVSQMAAAGMPVSGEFLNQRMRQDAVKGLISKLPPEIQAQARALAPGQRAPFAIDYLQKGEAQKQKMAAETEMWNVREVIQKRYGDEDGYVDWQRFGRDPEAARMFGQLNSLMNTVTPRIPGDESNEEYRTWLLTGQKSIAEGKSPKTVTGLTEEGNEIHNSISARARDGARYWDFSGGEQAFMREHMKIENPADYEKYLGMIKVGTKGSYAASESITNQAKSLINLTGSYPTLSHAIQGWASGELGKDPDEKPLYQFLEKNFQFGTINPKKEAVQNRAVANHIMGEIIDAKLELRAGKGEMLRWLTEAVGIGKGQWRPEWDAQLRKDGITQEEIDKYIKPAYEFACMGDLEGAIKVLKDPDLKNRFIKELKKAKIVDFAPYNLMLKEFQGE